VLWFRKTPKTDRLHYLGPWPRACAVGTVNGSLGGHSQLAGVSFNEWIEQTGLQKHSDALREYAHANAMKSYYGVLCDERALSGRRSFEARPHTESNQIKVVFLDFDGVLVPRHLANKQEADPQCVRLLNEIVEPPEVRIVISSNWRADYPLYSLLYCLREWGVDPGRVIDITPGIPGNHIRGIEIQAWLDERDERVGDVSRFVILDDNADMAHLIPYLVQSTLDVGLTHDLVILARNKLDGAQKCL
jgi:hypothetical protein